MLLKWQQIVSCYISEVPVLSTSAAFIHLNNCSLTPCIPLIVRHMLELGSLALVLSKLVGGRLVAVSMALEMRTLVCYKFVLGSNYRIECGELMMELGILGKLERGKMELADRLVLAGKLELVCRLELADKMVDIRMMVEVVHMIEALRSHRCMSYRRGSMLQEPQLRRQLL